MRIAVIGQSMFGQEVRGRLFQMRVGTWKGSPFVVRGASWPIVGVNGIHTLNTH